MLKNNGGFVCFTQTKAIQHLYIFLFHRVTPRAFTNRKTFCAVAASSYISICTVTQRTHHTNIVLAHTKALSDKKKILSKRGFHTQELYKKRFWHCSIFAQKGFFIHIFYTQRSFWTEELWKFTIMSYRSCFAQTVFGHKIEKASLIGGTKLPWREKYTQMRSHNFLINFS